MDRAEYLALSGVKLAIIGGLVENVHTIPYVGRFLDVVASAACKGVPFSLMGWLVWKLRWPNITTLDQLFPATFKEQQENGQFTGRTRRLDVDWFRKALQSRRCTRMYKAETHGGSYKYVPDFIRRRLEPENVLPIYKYNDGSRFSVVIKRISYRSQKLQKKKEMQEKEMQESAINEILAGSLRHFAVVPMIAWADDVAEKEYYLMFPYMKKKDLRHSIDADNVRIEKKESLILNDEQRLKILFQISCSMLFLHEEVHNFRGAVSHGDITTANILIDENDDARLADFGQSRFYRPGEMGIINNGLDPVGTPGYYDESRTDFLNTETDIRYFGIVILEMLTGCSPYDEGNNTMPLLQLGVGELQVKYSTHIGTVWRAKGRRQELFGLAEMCRKGKLNAKQINDTLDDLITDCTSLENTIDNFCRSCMVTEKMKDSKILDHNQNCERLQICVNCVKNSHINPMECHACWKKVTSPIGHNWGAICVAGYDKDSSIHQMFERDARAIYNMCLSKMPLSIGIREENAHIASSIQDIEDCITKLQQCDISTLFVFYSGHFHPDIGFDLKHGQSLKEIDLNAVLSRLTCKKVVCIFDCCLAPDIKQLQQQPVIFQLTASYPEQEVPIPEDRSGLSIFTKLVIEALNGKSRCCEYCSTNKADLCSSCRSDTGFVCIEQLRNYMSDHYRDMCKRESTEWDSCKMECQKYRVCEEKCQRHRPKQFLRCDPSTNTHGHISNLNNKVAFYQRDLSSVQFHVSLEGYQHVVIEVPQLERNIEMMLAVLVVEIRANCDVPTSLPSEALQVAIFPGAKCTELTSIEQIENAHATNQDIVVQFRRADNIHQGKIQIFKEGSDRIFSTLKRWSMKADTDETFLLMEAEQDTLGENKLFINLRDNGVRKMRKFIRENKYDLDTSDWNILKYFKNEVLKLALVSQIQEEGMLVVCFPLELDEYYYLISMNTSMFTVDWEPIKFNMFDYVKFQNYLIGFDWYDNTVYSKRRDFRKREILREAQN